MTYQDRQMFDALERRLAKLEQQHTSSRIKGWEAAARLLGVSSATIKRWWRTDPKFPKPVSTRIRGSAKHISPEWEAKDLNQYR